MKVYQQKQQQVNQSVEVRNMEILKEKASKGLMELSIHLGFEVLAQMLEADATELAGSKGKHNKGRIAYRHGYENTKVVLGGEKRSIKKPRVRSLEKDELQLQSLKLFQDEEPLSQAILSRLLNGVSSRKYALTLDTKTEESSCTSKSKVSREFISRLEQLMTEFFARPIDENYPIVMIDGMAVGEMMVIAVMGISEDGNKKILGLIEGATENHTIVKELLEDLIKRGFRKDAPKLFVIDGGKALYKGIKDVFGKNVMIQRCQVHKKRNVLSHLPKSEQTNVGLSISKAYMEFEYSKAKTELEMIVSNLEHRYPKAAASLLEGMEETLTVHQLKVPGMLRATISSTNALESANSIARETVKKVKKWKDGEHIIRTLAAGFVSAEKSFRRIKGFKQIPLLISEIHQILGFNKEQSSKVGA